MVSERQNSTAARDAFRLLDMKLPIFGVRTFLFAFRAIKRIFFRLIRRQPLLVDEATEYERLKICGHCEKNTGDGQCEICTCALKLKVMLDTEYCPLGKW